MNTWDDGGAVSIESCTHPQTHNSQAYAETLHAPSQCHSSRPPWLIQNNSHMLVAELHNMVPSISGLYVRIGEVHLLELVLFDLERPVQDLVSLVRANLCVYRVIQMQRGGNG